MFDFGASAINVGLQAFHDKKARKWQEDQINNKYNRDIEQRDYANWYNSPKNQMERFSEAGLNPHLIYGKGTSGNQASVPQAQTATGRFSKRAINFGDPLGELNKYQNFKKLNAETSLTKQMVLQSEMKTQIMNNNMSSELQIREQELKKAISDASSASERAILTEQLKLTQIEKLKVAKIHTGMWEKGVNPNASPFERHGGGLIQWIKDGMQEVHEKGIKIDTSNIFNND